MINVKQLFWAALTFWVLFIMGCIKESSTRYQTTIFNNSGRKIRFLPYSGNTPVLEKMIDLDNGDSSLIGDGIDRGIVNHGGFDSEYLNIMDSVAIIFDDSFVSIHYSKNPVDTSPNSITDENPRNIFEYLNYEYSHEDISKHRREAYYKYTVTNADYEFASE